MLDRVYKFVQTVSNNELNGNISPQEFKLLVNNSVEELYEENLQEARRANERDRRYGKVFSIENISDKLREKIIHYYTPAEIVKTDGKYPLPGDLRYLDSVEYKGVQVEPMQNRKHFKVVVQCADTAPDLATPVYLQIADKLELAPTTIVDKVDIFYLRSPKSANWTYQIIRNVEVFDPDSPDFQDIDIHKSEEYQLTVRVLQKLGINLKEEQLTEYGLRKEGTDFQKENA